MVPVSMLPDAPPNTGTHGKDGRPPRQSGARGAVSSQRRHILPVGSAPVRGEVSVARLPRSVGADVMHPLFLRKIVAGAKTEGGYQFLFVDEPELDFAIVAAAGQPPVRQHHQRPDLTLAACERIIGSSLPSFGHSLILPSLPPLTRRPSASGAGASIKLPWVRTIGSPAPSLGQSLILPSLPPPASRPSASTTRQYTSSITWPSTSEWPCDRITSGGPVNALLTRLDGVCLSRPVALARFQCFPQLKRRHARSHLAAPP